MLKRTFTTKKDGRKYQIIFDDEGLSILINFNKCKVGEIILDKRWELQSAYSEREYYYITNLSLDEIHQRKGIGTKCLLLHKKIFNIPIGAGSCWGIKNDDGSHLTGVGVPFIQKMRKKGIVLLESQNE